MAITLGYYGSLIELTVSGLDLRRTKGLAVLAVVVLWSGWCSRGSILCAGCKVGL